MKKRKIEYFASFLSVFGVGVLLIFALYVATNNGTLAWFSNNTVTNSTGLSVTAEGLPKTEEYLMKDGVRLSADASDIFADLIPGEKVSVTLAVENQTDGAITLRLCLAGPTEEDDTPLITESGAYCYFGTQIRINSITDSLDREHLVPTGTERYLLTLEESQYLEGSLPPTSIPDEYDFSLVSEKQLTGEITIAEGEVLLLDIELEFVDNGTLQNEYINFGVQSGESNASNTALTRTLVCYYANK